MVWVVGVIVVAAAFALGLWAYDRFINPQERIEVEGLHGVRFPQVRGSNLAGQGFTLPQDIQRDYALLMIAFQQVHQFDVNTWLPTARDLSQQYESLAYYELPTIDRLNPAARLFIDGGMRAGIPDPVARATTITLYLDKPSFRQALDIPDEESIVVMLINREGEVLWRTSGPASPEAIEALQQAAKASLE
jgi:hypothetical protein